jgi:hypothetical protein
MQDWNHVGLLELSWYESKQRERSCVFQGHQFIPQLKN